MLLWGGKFSRYCATVNLIMMSVRCRVRAIDSDLGSDVIYAQFQSVLELPRIVALYLHMYVCIYITHMGIRQNTHMY